MLRAPWILLAAMAMLTLPMGCPGDDDDASDDDTGDDDTGDDDTADDDSGDDDTGSPDADGDGFTVADGDCDDGDPDVNPDATEYCYDELDNDCDGDTDVDDADGCPLNTEEIVVQGGGATLTIPVGAIYGEVPMALAEVAPAEPIPGAYRDLGVTFGVEPFELPLQEPATLEIFDSRGSILCTPIGLYLPYLAAVLWELQAWVTVELIDGSWVLTFDAFGIFAVVVDALGVDDDGDLYCEGPMDCCDAAVLPGDCNDLDADVSPDATEVCDSIDNDCDWLTDEPDAADALSWYADADGDSYGDFDETQVACDAPTGYVQDGTDCDDDPLACGDLCNPGETEICDGWDNNCDGGVDEGQLIEYYPDVDGDGYGDQDATPIAACSAPTGHVTDGTDCDDDPAACGGSCNPGMPEACDGLDNDCDGAVPADETADGDGDGHVACDDCDDADDQVAAPPDWYADADGDGYGDPAVVQTSCTEPSGFVADDTDCDDDPAGCGAGCYPSGLGEHCDGWDNDCDGLDLHGVDFALGNEIDQDGDGYVVCFPWVGSDPTVVAGDDCDDDASDDPPWPYAGAAAVHPDADEIPDDHDPRIDENCDGYAPCASLDCDGYAEIIAVVTHNGSTHEHDSVIYFGEATGWWNNNTLGVPTIHGFDVVAADLDGDEYLDLVFANYLTPAGGYEGVSYIYWNDPQNPGAFSDQDRLELPTKGCRGVEAGDLNGDGWVDLVFSSMRDDVDWDSEAYLYWNDPNDPDHFSDTLRTEFPVYESMNVAIVDVDGGGFPDLVFAQGPNHYGRIYWGSGDPDPLYAFDPGDWNDLADTYDCTGVTAVDLNQSGDPPDLVFTSIATPALSPVLHNDGSGNFTLDVTLNTTNTRDVVAVDFHGDGDLDSAFANYGSGVMGQIFWDGGGGTYSTGNYSTASSNSLRVAGGDIDLDGYDDLAFTGGLGDSVDVYLGDPGGLNPMNHFPLYLGYYSVCGVTFVGDGIPAAVWNPNP